MSQPELHAALASQAYERAVEYYLRDEPQWRQFIGPVIHYPPLSRWQRALISIAGRIDQARYKIGHWIAGPCPEYDGY